MLTILMAQAVTQASRGSKVPLTEDWVRSFRRRHGLTRLRQCSSDKPDDTAQDIANDNEWRVRYNDFVTNPAMYGVTGAGPIPSELQLGLDESPLPYFPKQRGTMVELGNTRRIVLARASDKRQVTGTPVFSRSGRVLVYQIIWRGKTVKSLPRCHIPGRMLMAVAPKKVQTRQTFLDLIKDIHARLLQVRQDIGLEAAHPSVIVLDNVSSHQVENMCRPPNCTSAVACMCTALAQWQCNRFCTRTVVSAGLPGPHAVVYPTKPVA